MSAPLAHSVALISGALGDIGRAIALELARRGADVALGDVLDDAAAQPLIAQIAEIGRRARYDRVDVADAVSVRGWVERCEATLGLPTLVIPNAAVVASSGCLEIAPEEWRRQIRVDLDGAFFVAQAAALRLRARGAAGRIVFVGSWAADRPHPHIPAYSAAKAGLRAAMRCMALELAPLGILVNEVAPGYVDAGLSGRMFVEDPPSKAVAIATVPIGRLIGSEDVALAVAHLCDPSVTHCAGMVYAMDGGLSLQTGKWS